MREERALIYVQGYNRKAIVIRDSHPSSSPELEDGQLGWLMMQESPFSDDTPSTTGGLTFSGDDINHQIEFHERTYEMTYREWRRLVVSVELQRTLRFPLISEKTYSLCWVPRIYIPKGTIVQSGPASTALTSTGVTTPSIPSSSTVLQRPTTVNKDTVVNQHSLGGFALLALLYGYKYLPHRPRARRNGTGKNVEVNGVQLNRNLVNWWYPPDDSSSSSSSCSSNSSVFSYLTAQTVDLQCAMDPDTSEMTCQLPDTGSCLDVLGFNADLSVQDTDDTGGAENDTGALSFTTADLITDGSGVDNQPPEVDNNNNQIGEGVVDNPPPPAGEDATDNQPDSDNSSPAQTTCCSGATCSPEVSLCDSSLTFTGIDSSEASSSNTLATHPCSLSVPTVSSLSTPTVSSRPCKRPCIGLLGPSFRVDPGCPPAFRPARFDCNDVSSVAATAGSCDFKGVGWDCLPTNPPQRVDASCIHTCQQPTRPAPGRTGVYWFEPVGGDFPRLGVEWCGNPNPLPDCCPGDVVEDSNADESTIVQQSVII